MNSLFDAAGGLRDAYRRVDWALSPVGTPGGWSPALRSAVDLTLNTRFAVTLFWGPRYTMIYNEAYAAVIADKHPAALGAAAEDVFPEIWDEIGPMLDSVWSGNGATWVEDLRLLLDRRGYLEETFFTFSYSPIASLDGGTEGIIDIAAETTGQVLARRRLVLLSRLGDALNNVEVPADLLERALPVLREDSDDLPSVDVLLPTPGGPLPAPVSGTRYGRDLVVEEAPDGLVAKLRLRSPAGSARDAHLVVRLSPHLAMDESYLRFLGLIGESLGHAWNRTYSRAAERRVADLERKMSEALQHSLLTPPLRPNGTDLDVRYQPALEGAHVGGDWYDSFCMADGALAIVIGDVAGHDRRAAAAMGQIRSLIRGISYAGPSAPAEVVGRLDDALAGLAVDAFATLVMARVGQDDSGRTMLCWSNAGHPPPVLVTPAGVAELLATPSEIMVGARTGTARHDHERILEPGTTVVFYSDGLVERRNRRIDDGLEELCGVLTGRQGDTAEEICDHLIARYGATAEDDIVLVALRTLG